MSKNMINLNKVVEDWAWVKYEKTATRKQKRLLKKQEEKKEKYIGLQIDWSSAKFIDETKWIRGDANVSLESAAKQEGRQMGTGRTVPEPPEGPTVVLFETKFVNNTDVPQKYTMRTEKTTRSTINTSIERGLMQGFDVGIKLATPCNIFEASVGFKKEVTLSNSKGETFEEELTWGVESEIQVNPNEVVEASLIVNQGKWTGNFLVTTKISGTVYVTFTNIKDNNSFLKSCGGDILYMVKEYKDKGRERDLSFLISDKVFSVETAGKCKFRYGVSQQVKVNKRDPTPDERAANDKYGDSQ